MNSCIRRMRPSLQALGLHSAPTSPHGGCSLPLFLSFFFPTLSHFLLETDSTANSLCSSKKSSKCWEMSVWLRDLLDQQGVRRRDKICLYVCNLGLTQVMIKQLYSSTRLNQAAPRGRLNTLVKL